MLTLISSSFFFDDFLGVDLAEFVSGVAVVEEEGEEAELSSSSSFGSFLTSTFWSVMVKGRPVPVVLK